MLNVPISDGAPAGDFPDPDADTVTPVNDPLSPRRAQAVQQVLSALLTRNGIRFQTQGYGSRRPLYSNDSDEGKRRNRRVTVAFAKPQPATQEPVATTTSGATGLTGTTKADGQPIAMEVTGLRRLPGGVGLLNALPDTPTPSRSRSARFATSTFLSTNGIQRLPPDA
jgi:hypothetical protein